MFYESIGAEFLEFLEEPVKLKICLILVNSCYVERYKMLQNGQMRRIKFSLIKMIQQHQEVFMKYNKSIEEVIQSIGF